MATKPSTAGPDQNPYGAFVEGPRLTISGVKGGPLSGLTFAVKDSFDIEGYVTGNGHPKWLETHRPAGETAWAVARLIEQGADLVGKTQCDEIQYSLNGENWHYGTPDNPAAHGRIPGGSSSGSAVAVAAGLCDFAVGTDCGGSVRLPASYCGIFGFRPTHGRIPVTGGAPLAPSFDTVGWFARDPEVLKSVGEALIAERSDAFAPKRLIIADDAFSLAGEVVANALEGAVELLSKTIAAPCHATVSAEGLDTSWLPAFRHLQGAELWSAHKAWIESANPEFGPGIKERFAIASAIGGEQVDAAQKVRASASRQVRELLRDDGLLCVPSAPGIAPLKGTEQSALEDFRNAALSILCIAGLSGLPQISLPLAELEGCPLGLSLIGPPTSDLGLLALSLRLKR